MSKTVYLSVIIVKHGDLQHQVFIFLTDRSVELVNDGKQSLEVNFRQTVYLLGMFKVSIHFP